MCGIMCEICYSECTAIVDQEVLQRLKNRGPDCTHSLVNDASNDMKVYYYGTVLWMQGSTPTVQPINNDHGVLLFNGDIFDDTWTKDLSDTQLIMEKLSNNVKCSKPNILKEIQMFKGPFSLIYHDTETNCLYFTRDRIGRNTLLFHKSNKSIVISSVLGRKYSCIEVPATHIHKLNLNNNIITLYSWTNIIETNEYPLQQWIDILQEQQQLPDDQFLFHFDPNIAEEDEHDVIKFIEYLSRNIECKLTMMKTLMTNVIIQETVQKLIELLEYSVKVRLKTQPNKCKNCITYKISKCNHCTVGILFSGGLDCTILAVLADMYVDKDQPIDLINVAFAKDKECYDVPDRVTGKQSFNELRELCKTRQWVFHEINVPKVKLEKYQKSTIADLVFPRNTILDESLGSALWFAASGENCDPSTCRVLLLGSGADELFGGYLRHRKAYQRQGWTELAKELQLDWNRISFRNLARDNRVICDHGRQPRMPYLDEDFSNFVLNLKPWLRCFPSEVLECGIGDKLMLRLVALKLGLTRVVTFPKRALQFGSRIANKKQKGGDLSKTFIDT